MPELIAGMDKKQLLIYGGIGALGVGIVVYLRYQSAQNTPPQEAFPQAPPDMGGGGYGTPVSVSAPSQNAADQYQAGLKQAEVDAANLQNQYMGEQLRQSKSAFDLQQNLQLQEANIMAPVEKAYAGLVGSQYGAQENYYNQIAKRQVSCPGSDSVRIDPTTGEAYCRQKTSGGFLGLPVGDIVRAVQGFVGGVERAAPSVGYNAAQAAGSYYTNQYFPKAQTVKKTQAQKPKNYGQLPPQGNYGGNF